MDKASSVKFQKTTQVRLLDLGLIGATERAVQLLNGVAFLGVSNGGSKPEEEERSPEERDGDRRVSGSHVLCNSCLREQGMLQMQKSNMEGGVETFWCGSRR